MSVITNRLALPEPIYRAVAGDQYRSKSETRIGVTTLIGPPRKAALERQHADELVEDCSERIWALLGQAVHAIIEKAGTSGLAEQRLTLDVLGWTVSGILDHFAYMPDGTLDDFKVSSTWSAKEGGKLEWEQQTNIYAHMLRAHGHTVTRARIVLICRDWRKNEWLRYGSSGYPAQQVAVLPVPLWEPERVQRYLEERVRLHQAARAGDLPHCTDDERWKRPTQWAVKKDGQKKAVKLCDTEDEAKAIIGQAPKMFVEKRPGLAVRCAQYCSALPFCQKLADGQFQDGDLPDVDSTEVA